MVNHKLASELIDLGIIYPEEISEFYHKVRDNDNIKVLRCNKSKVIFLDSIDHISQSYYNNLEELNYWNSDNRAKALESTYKDDFRRYNFIKELIDNKNYLDIGCGLGGIFEFVIGDKKNLYGIEPQETIRKELISLGYKVYSDIDELLNQDVRFDLITLFHVFEHLTNPLEFLEKIYKLLNKNGKLIIEVPNAEDALISLYNVESFKKSTFWSEHLVLHTKNSLEAYLRKTNFSNISVQGIQRYNLSNHINWIMNNQINKIYKEFIDDEELNKYYCKALDKTNNTDTLISICEKK